MAMVGEKGMVTNNHQKEPSDPPQSTWAASFRI